MWTYDKRPSDFRIQAEYQGANGPLLRTVGRVTREDDARLIAAAPDLLAALQRAREELAWFANEHQCCKLTDGVMDDIDAALKKATQP